MSARTGLADIIAYVRLHADLEEDSITVNGVSYWTDDQIQLILDMFRKDVRGVLLMPLNERLAGVSTYLRYYIPDEISNWLENSPEQLQVLDVLGNAPSISYTIDLDSRVVIFASNTLGKAYYLYAREYDVRPAIAEFWLTKIGLLTQLVDWKAGGQSINESQEYQHCMEQYKEWSGYKGIKSSRLAKVGYGKLLDYMVYIPGIGYIEPYNPGG